ncbi:MAG: methionine--tRNA ligase subunit beta, partial [Candidatus Kapaibacterium sp.]
VKYVESKSGIWRDTVVQQARSWLKAGLQDRPITRDLDWGVPVPLPNAEGKVLYVWFDAPIGYVTATKELLPDDWQSWWRDDENLEWVCFLGKDNIVFHTIMFPAMELGYNKQGDFTYQLPTQVPANEFMNLEGRRLSKSRGWTIEAHEILQRYDADLIRYTIACNLPETKDSDFSWKDFQAHTNSELADILGNYANRVLTFAHRYFDGKVPAVSVEFQNTSPLYGSAEKTAVTVSEAYESFKLREALKLTMDFARDCNKFINDEEPWKTAKKNIEKTAVTIYRSLEALRALAFYFSPIIPGTSRKIEEMLNYSSKDDRWDTAFQPKLKAGHVLGDVAILFTKIEDMQMDGEIQSLRKMSEQYEKVAASDAAARSAERSVAEPKPIGSDGQITIDDFKRIKLRTAVVIEAEPVPKSKKLLKLQIAIGEERRQIVAGIAEKYSPEDLVGKTIVVVANLAPAKLMGIESQGMLLAVNDEKGPVAIVSPISNTESGLEVR